MRVRSRGGILPTPVSYVVEGEGCYNGNCAPFSGTGSHTAPSGEVEIFRDQVTPGYFRTLRNREILPINPCSSEKALIPLTGWSAQRVQRGTSVNTVTTTNAQCALPFDVFNSDAFGHAGSPPDPLDTFADSVASVRGDLWDFSTFLLEFGKTVKMFTQLSGRLLRFYRQVTKGLSTSRPDVVLKAVSEAWLEYRYGWRILYYDIQDFLKTLDRLRGVRENIVRSSREQTSQSTREVVLNSFGDQFNRYKIPIKVLATTSWTARSGAIGQTETSLDVSIDPIVTMWELTRWSFVLDWFFNVGSFLQAVSPFQSGNVKFGWGSVKGVTSLRVVGNPVLDDPRVIDTIIVSPYAASYETYERYPLNPQSDIELRFRPQLSGSKLVDLFALSQAASGGPLSRR